MELDKFYTKHEVAGSCYSRLMLTLNIDPRDTFLEPTAGNGVFLDFLHRYEAYDLKPEDSRIKQMDIFDFSPKKHDYVTIGNPPFGKRSRLAISIFNHVSKFSNVVAFILPVSFVKYNVQSKLDPDFKLAFNGFLPENSFLVNGKPYDVNCVFQIWVRKGSKYDQDIDDLRIYKRPSIKTPDLKIWQYNATDEAFGTVDEDWEIAVYRQGFKDYTKKFFQTDKQTVINEMSGKATGKKVQFFFIKPLTKQARKIVMDMDYERLAMGNTSTPGFGKADFIMAYEELKKAANEAAN